MPHTSALKRRSALAGRAPLRQIGDNASAMGRIAVPKPHLGAILAASTTLRVFSA